METKLLIFLFGIFTQTYGYKNCYYCYTKNLGYCAKKEINIHREHCPESKPSLCHTISSVTVHSGNGRTLIKYCNETISTCENLNYKKKTGDQLLLCCSSCDSSGNALQVKTNPVSTTLLVALLAWNLTKLL